MLIGIIWLSKALYLLPDFVEYIKRFISRLNGDEISKFSNFDVVSYILKIVIALLFVFKVEQLSNWILKRI